MKSGRYQDMGHSMVSVVMAVYNERPYLQEAVQSILDQTFEDFEFIIINDGSTDGSKEVLECFADRDDRIRLAHQENKGLIASLNRGLDMARGQYIARMDGDDISHPERLEKQVDFLNANSEIGILGTQIEWINSEGETIGSWSAPADPDLIAWKLLFNTCLDHPTILARKSLLLNLGGYAEWTLHAEDYELWTRAVRKSRLASLPGTLLKHRQHDGSITVKRRREQIQMVCRAAANLHQELLRGSFDEEVTHFLVWAEIKGISEAITETNVCHLSRVQTYLRRLYAAYTETLCSGNLNTQVRRRALAKLQSFASASEGSTAEMKIQKLKNRLMPPRIQILPWVFVCAKEKLGFRD